MKRTIGLVAIICGLVAALVPVSVGAVTRTGSTAYYGKTQKISRQGAVDGKCRGAFHGFPLGEMVRVVRPKTGKVLVCANVDVCNPTVRKQPDGSRRSDCAVINERNIIAELDYWSNQKICPARSRPQDCRTRVTLIR